jgi:scyllo-inositol 2-dehydrogenase (NADP+)
MKILTIGTSIITTHFCEAVLKSKHSTINAVYSRDLKKAESFARTYNALSYDNLEEALNDLNIDTVYVASVNSLHFEHAKMAIEAKKNVILEKPSTHDAKEFSYLLDIAKSHKVIILEAITTMFLPNYTWIKENIHTIGVIKSVYAAYHQFSSKYEAYLNHENPNIFTLTHSGGCLVDLNVYNLHFILSLFDKPKKAKYYPILGYNGIDISGVAILEYESFNAIASASKSHHGAQTIVIEGELGTLRVSSAANTLRQVTISTKDTILSSDNIDTQNVLEYEVLVMEELMNDPYNDSINILNNHSLKVIDIMSKIRKDANIHFKGEANETLF